MTQNRIAKPKSLTTLALERIRDGIRSGQYPMGSPLFEKVVAEEFGISKTPVREALVQLQHDGLVVIVPHSGTFVFSLDDSALRDLCELRLILETNALQIALHRAPGALTAELDGIVKKMSEAIRANDTASYRELDSAFHGAFFVHAGNAYLTRSYESIEAKVSTLRTTLIKPLPNLKALSLDEHQKLVRALTANDTGTAIALLTAHIRRSRDLMQTLNDVAPIDITRV